MCCIKACWFCRNTIHIKNEGTNFNKTTSKLQQKYNKSSTKLQQNYNFLSWTFVEISTKLQQKCNFPSWTFVEISAKLQQNFNSWYWMLADISSKLQYNKPCWAFVSSLTKPWANHQHQPSKNMKSVELNFWCKCNTFWTDLSGLDAGIISRWWNNSGVVLHCKWQMRIGEFFGTCSRPKKQTPLLGWKKWAPLCS